MTAASSPDMAHIEITTESDLSLSEVSSPLSSPPDSPPSSPLSSLASTPEPPDAFAMFANMPPAHVELPYPSPPASQQTSQSGSPAPDSNMDSSTEKDGPPPAKRRRISRDPKDRTTEYIDLRSGKLRADQREHLDCVVNELHKRQKIVVIAGAGMSKSAGVPDFRSRHGLFSSLKKQHNLKGSGQHLFDASVYKDDASTQQFHHMISEMSQLTKAAKPTPFHHMIATIAKEGRLMRLYSQNVDGLDTGLEPLQTRVPLSKDENGQWPKTLQLHGGLEKMVCTKCHKISDLDPALFDGPIAPLCSQCEELNTLRTDVLGKRSHGVGRLRPRMVLYHEQGPDEEAIGRVAQQDLKRKPDTVIVVGTTLKVKGLQRIVKEMCATVRDRRDGGLAIWINPEAPPAAGGFRDCFDIIIQGTSDAVAERAAMRRWDEEPVPEGFREVSEEAAAKLATKSLEVHLPRCELPHASPVPLPSAEHQNNSFAPPPPTSTPIADPDARRPVDWSPLSTRRSSIRTSIEHDAPEGENITVSQDGLLTPSKSARSTPAFKPTLPTITEMLKDNGNSKSKKPATKSSKSKATTKISLPNSKKIAQSTIKSVKPSATKRKTSNKAKPAAKPNASLTNAFSQSKSASTAAKNGAAKKDNKASLPSPAKSPSKLRQVSNASEPMTLVKSQDARVNKSSPQKINFFPGLAGTENGVAGKKRKGVDV